jgi:hypothetical protein
VASGLDLFKRKPTVQTSKLGYLGLKVILGDSSSVGCFVMIVYSKWNNM